jgi:hypothetical protein
MTENTSLKIRLIITAVVSIAIWLLLGWNYFHGGIPRHHLLARNDLPEFSNAWGGLLLPLLTFFLLYRIQKRVEKIRGDNAHARGQLTAVKKRFSFALLFGILLATFFAMGYPDICGYMIDLLLLLALFFPIYFSELLLGFFLGMTYTFGAVLPTLIGAVLTIIVWILYKFVRPLFLWLIAGIAKKIPGKN